MELVLVTAICEFDYKGRLYQAGDILQMPAIDAALHIDERNVSGDRHPRLTLANITPEPPAASEPAPAHDPPPPPRRRRSYRRKDIVAEQP